MLAIYIHTLPHMYTMQGSIGVVGNIFTEVLFVLVVVVHVITHKEPVIKLLML